LARERPENPNCKKEGFMKVKVIEKVKFAPGKWKEAGELMKTFKQAGEKFGFPPFRIYAYISGGDAVQTLSFVTDWDSLASMETLMDKMLADPETMQMMEKWAGVVESHEVSILKELSPQELGMA
jgi:hypothetical protein